MDFKTFVESIAPQDYQNVCENIKRGKGLPLYFSSVLVKSSADLFNIINKSLYNNGEIDYRSLEVYLTDVLICAQGLANFVGKDLTTILNDVMNKNE